MRRCAMRSGGKVPVRRERLPMLASGWGKSQVRRMRSFP
jgi:hypothetical protein